MNWGYGSLVSNRYATTSNTRKAQKNDNRRSQPPPQCYPIDDKPKQKGHTSGRQKAANAGAPGIAGTAWGSEEKLFARLAEEPFAEWPSLEAEATYERTKKSRHVAPSSCHDFILMRDAPCPTLYGVLDLLVLSACQRESCCFFELPTEGDTKIRQSLPSKFSL